MRKGLRPAVLSPESESDQVSGWMHTGMHVPKGCEREIFKVEQKRYPYLRVRESGVPDQRTWSVLLRRATAAGQRLPLVLQSGAAQAAVTMSMAFAAAAAAAAAGTTAAAAGAARLGGFGVCGRGRGQCSG